MHLRKAAEDVSVLKMRCSINADTMTKAELHQKLKTGYRDIGKGRVRNASFSHSTTYLSFFYAVSKGYT